VCVRGGEGCTVGCEEVCVCVSVCVKGGEDCKLSAHQPVYACKTI